MLCVDMMDRGDCEEYFQSNYFVDVVKREMAV